MKRNIWIPKMTKNKLEKLLSKPFLSDNDKEYLLDFKYFMITYTQDALEKGLLVQLLVSQKEVATCPKNIFWLTNIEQKTRDFQSKYYL